MVAPQSHICSSWANQRSSHGRMRLRCWIGSFKRDGTCKMRWYTGSGMNAECLLASQLSHAFFARTGMNVRCSSVSQLTISHLFCKHRWSKKELRRISLNRSEELRQRYRDEMSQFAAEDLIFLDESIFNEKTG